MRRSESVLVSGGSGFIGRATIAPLQALGFEVHVAGRHAPAAACQFHRTDLLDHAQLADLLKRVQPVNLLHLAWDVTPGLFWTSPANLDWIAASLNLYRAFVAQGGKRALFAGTCAEYDWSCSDLDEQTSPLHPSTLYGAAKLSLFRVLTQASLLDGISFAWARLFMLYGPHEYEQRLLPSVILPLLRGEPALCGDGKAQRDFMHVEDVGRALVHVLAGDYQGPINIASGECVPIVHVIDTIASLIGRADLVRMNARAGNANEPPRLAASIARLRSLGFAPHFTLESGLGQTLAWWKGLAPARG